MTIKSTQETEGYIINVIGRHVAVTDAMKQYATDKVSKIDRFKDRVYEVDVTMDIQKLEHTVDIMMWVENTKIKVSAGSDNMYASVDKATDRLQRKLRRYRTRLHDHHAKALSAVDMEVNVIKAPVDEELAEINDQIEEVRLKEIEESLKPHEIVSKETRPLKTLTGQEAIMKMDLSQDQFMIFRSEADKKLRVIYRRNDGNYGIIEPE